MINFYIVNWILRNFKIFPILVLAAESAIIKIPHLGDVTTNTEQSKNDFLPDIVTSLLLYSGTANTGHAPNHELPKRERRSLFHKSFICGCHFPQKCLPQCKKLDFPRLDTSPCATKKYRLTLKTIIKSCEKKNEKIYHSHRKYLASLRGQ